MDSRTEKKLAMPMFIALGLLALFFAGGKLGSPANAQAELQAVSTAGIMAVPIQIERDKYGLAMVDTASQTLWIYEINTLGPAHSRLRLLAARSWQYDKLLKQYNTAEPKPEQVKMLLEEESSSKQPTEKERVNEQQRGSDVNVAEANVAEVNTAEVNAAEVNTAEVNAAEVNEPNE